MGSRAVIAAWAAVLLLSCAFVDANIYNDQCVTSMDGEDYDLNPLNGAFTKILEVILSEEFALYFKINPCEQLKRTGTCEANCCVQEAPEDNHQPQTQGLGQRQWTACGSQISYQPLPAGVAKHGITQVYSGGQTPPGCPIMSPSQMHIQFACKEGAGLGQPTTAANFPHSATGQCIYKFLWETDVVCPSHLSLGWIFVITFLCCAITYLVGGIVYKKKRLGATGIEAIPNIDFWQQLPSLVMDGCAFFWEWAQTKYQNMNSNRYENMDESTAVVDDGA